MRISYENIQRIEIIPETDEEKQVCQDILDGKALFYWGDAGENFTPPEMLGGLIINTYQLPTPGTSQLDVQEPVVAQ